MSNENISSLARSVLNPSESLPQNGKSSGTSASATQANNAANEKPATEPNHDQIAKAAEKFSQYMNSTSRDLRFLVDQDTGKIIVKVIDKNSGDVIRQIPSEEVLAVAKTLTDEASQGVIIRQKA